MSKLFKIISKAMDNSIVSFVLTLFPCCILVMGIWGEAGTASKVLLTIIVTAIFIGILARDRVIKLAEEIIKLQAEAIESGDPELLQSVNEIYNEYNGVENADK